MLTGSLWESPLPGYESAPVSCYLSCLSTPFPICILWFSGYGDILPTYRGRFSFDSTIVLSISELPPCCPTVVLCYINCGYSKQKISIANAIPWIISEQSYLFYYSTNLKRGYMKIAVLLLKYIDSLHSSFFDSITYCELTVYFHYLSFSDNKSMISSRIK